MLGDGSGAVDNTPPNVKIIERVSDKVSPNMEIAHALNKLFKRVKMLNKPHISTEGDDVDVEEYVERYINGLKLNECLMGVTKSNGASIVVSIDGSTSMRFDRIDTARNLVATLYKSVEGLKGVEIRGNIWSSNGNGEIGITEINNEKDVKNITVHDKYPCTPTHMGLDYSAKMLKEMKGNKKFLFLITDGAPNYYNDGKRIQRYNYLKMCNRSLKKVLKLTPNVVCILVNSNPYHRYDLRVLFTKKRVLVFRNMERASEKVITQFKGVIMSR